MKVDSDPMEMEEAQYTEPIEILMVKADDGSNMDVNKGEQISAIADSDFQEVYAQYEEGLIVFLEHYKLNEFKTMMFPHCNVVFDEKEAKKLESFKRVNHMHGWGRGRTSRFIPNDRGKPRRNEEYMRQFQQPRQKTFRSPATAP